MKKILISVMTFVLVVGLVGGGAFALFNDTETSTGNTFSAGTLDLTVDDRDDDPELDYLVDEGGDPIVYVELEDMAPCEWVLIGPITLTNTGTIDGIADLHFMNVVDEDDGVSSEPEDVADPNGEIYDISTYIWVDVFYEDEVIIDEYQKTLRGLECIPIDLGLLPAEESADLYLSFHLDGEVGNAYQGDGCTFDIVFTLHQVLPVE